MKTSRSFTTSTYLIPLFTSVLASSEVINVVKNMSVDRVLDCLIVHMIQSNMSLVKRHCLRRVFFYPPHPGSGWLGSKYTISSWQYFRQRYRHNILCLNASLASYRDTEVEPCWGFHSSLHVSYRCPFPVTSRPTYYKQNKKGASKINDETTNTQDNYRTIKKNSGSNVRPGQQKSSGQGYKPKQRKGHPNSRISTLVTIDTGSGINITHDKSLLLDYEVFNSPLTTYFGVGSEEHQIPIKLIGQGYFPLKYSATETIGMPTPYCPDEDITIISPLQLNHWLGVHFDLTYDHLVFPDFWPDDFCWSGLVLLPEFFLMIL